MHYALRGALSGALMELESGADVVLASGPREGLRSRLAVLGDAMRPAEPAHVRAAYASLAGMPAQASPGQEAARVLFEQDLADMVAQGFPGWAWAEAAHRWRMGTAHGANLPWRPTAGQLRGEAVRVVAPFAAELSDLDKLREAGAFDPAKIAAPRISADRFSELQAMLAGAAVTA